MDKITYYECVVTSSSLVGREFQRCYYYLLFYLYSVALFLPLLIKLGLVLFAIFHCSDR